MQLHFKNMNYSSKSVMKIKFCILKIEKKLKVIWVLGFSRETELRGHIYLYIDM